MSKSPRWNFHLLLFWNGCAALLLLTLFVPPFSQLWKRIDLAFFHLVNTPLKDLSSLRLWCAMANHRLADWIEDLCLLALYVAAILRAPRGSRKSMGITLFCTALLTAATILLFNRFLCRDVLRIRRDSPTNMVENAVFLSDYITSMTVKINSAKSFPGDHATTALMVTISYALVVRGRLAILALLYGALLCLPRLAAGAHWLSDILVGSMAIVMLSLSIAFSSPYFTLAAKRRSS